MAPQQAWALAVQSILVSFVLALPHDTHLLHAICSMLACHRFLVAQLDCHVAQT